MFRREDDAGLLRAKDRRQRQLCIRGSDGTVRIPMSCRCESLNAAVAASVLLWEAYRGEKGE